MVRKKNVKIKKETSNNEVKKDFSWKKIILTIIFGIGLGYIFTLNGPGQISKEMFFLLTILALLACVLAILLDIRQILLVK